MANRSKQVGTAAESAVVKYILDKGLYCHRKTLSGAVDEGDVWVVMPSGGIAVIQVKAGRSAETASIELMDRWLRDAEDQAGAAKGDMAFLVTKVSGRGDARVGDWTLSWRTPHGRVQGRLSMIAGLIKETN